MGVDDRQDPQFPARCELIVHKVHGPDLIAVGRICSILPELCPDPTLGRLVSKLKAQLIVKPSCSLHVDGPSLSLQKHVNTPISIADAGLADLLDAVLERCLLAALAFVGVEGPVDPQG